MELDKLLEGKLLEDVSGFGRQVSEAAAADASRAGTAD